MKFDAEICKGVSCPECSFNKGEDGCLLAKRLDEIEIIPEPCKDVVNRQAEIDALVKRTGLSWENLKIIHPMFCVLENLPSVQPERKTGRWIYGEDDVAMCDGYHCSECGFFVPWDYKRKFIDYIEDYNFCPHCGADMRGEKHADD